MRGYRTIAGAFMAMLLVATPAIAQGRGMGQGMGNGQGMGVRNPAAVVLEHRADLDLTSEQVESLEGLRAALEAENGPRIERLQAAASADEMRQIREEIRSTNRGAGLAIHEILTDEQESLLRPIMHQGRPGMGPENRPAAGRGGMAAGRGARAGSAGRGMRGAAHGMGQGAVGQGRALSARNPAEALLSHREALGLTDEQVARVTAIRDRVERENQPRRERLEAAIQEIRSERAGMTVEERRAARAGAGDRMAPVRALREEMRATNRAAGEEIHELLTPEQEARLLPLMREGRGGAPGKGMGPRGAGR